MAASPTLTVRDTAEVDHAAPSDTDLRRHRPRLMEDPSKQKVPPRQPRVFSTCFNLSGRVNSFNLRPLSPVSSSAVFSNGPSKIPRDVLRPKEPEKGAAAPPPVSRSPSPVPPPPVFPKTPFEAAVTQDATAPADAAMPSSPLRRPLRPVLSTPVCSVLPSERLTDMTNLTSSSGESGAYFSTHTERYGDRHIVSYTGRFPPPRTWRCHFSDVSADDSAFRSPAISPPRNHHSFTPQETAPPLPPAIDCNRLRATHKHRYTELLAAIGNFLGEKDRRTTEAYAAAERSNNELKKIKATLRESIKATQLEHELDIVRLVEHKVPFLKDQLQVAKSEAAKANESASTAIRESDQFRCKRDAAISGLDQLRTERDSAYKKRDKAAHALGETHQVYKNEIECLYIELKDSRGDL